MFDQAAGKFFRAITIWAFITNEENKFYFAFTLRFEMLKATWAEVNYEENVCTLFSTTTFARFIDNGAMDISYIFIQLFVD